MHKTVVIGLLVVVTLGLLLAPVLPFVNTPALWFGLPRIMVWMAALVVAITPLLAVLEFTRDGEPDDAGPAGTAEEVAR